MMNIFKKVPDYITNGRKSQVFDTKIYNRRSEILYFSISYKHLTKI
jgi:hypothetical protein